MSDGPKISVLMPVHNGMPYLPETTESILGQTYRSFELVAVDDGFDGWNGAVLARCTTPECAIIGSRRLDWSLH